MILGKILREMSFQIIEAADGQQAFNLLNSGEAVDVMMVDWNMPVMNGYELVCAVRANPLHGNIRILMITTETSMDQVQRALAAGANEYLMKPFTKEALVDKLALLGI